MKNLIIIIFSFFCFNIEASLPISNDQLGKWHIKNLESTFKKVSDKIYMAETEVTNQQYNYFLTYLLEQKDFNTLLKAKSDKVDWSNLVPKEFQNLSLKDLYPFNIYPDNPYNPAQNMSYEGAVLFCEWLTNFYNRESTEKRKWKKVKFRLPTEIEWMRAARGQNPQNKALYPWGFDSPKNKKGCFLSNFNCSNDNCECTIFDKNVHKVTKDGALFTTKADAYFPNDLGLYGMSGNVAEMVAEKGIAKGGSWEDIPSDCTIPSQKKYNTPSPAIGFRILMEILE